MSDKVCENVLEFLREKGYENIDPVSFEPSEADPSQWPYNYGSNKNLADIAFNITALATNLEFLLYYKNNTVIETYFLYSKECKQDLINVFQLLKQHGQISTELLLELNQHFNCEIGQVDKNLIINL